MTEYMNNQKLKSHKLIILVSSCRSYKGILYVPNYCVFFLFLCLIQLLLIKLEKMCLFVIPVFSLQIWIGKNSLYILYWLVCSIIYTATITLTYRFMTTIVFSFFLISYIWSINLRFTLFSFEHWYA